MTAPRIALIGKMHAGKSTVAARLVERHGYSRLALADALKDDCADLLDTFCGDHLPELPPITRATIDEHKAVFRPFLQWFGTEFVRKFLGQDEYWIEQFAAVLDGCDPDWPVVCDDVRFGNEAAALRAMGFRLVKIERPVDDREASLRARYDEAAIRAITGHPSEAEVDCLIPDRIVFNDGAVADLIAAADALAEEGAPCLVASR